MKNKNLHKILLPKANLRISLKEEDHICYEFANYLRQQTLLGAFPYVWFHIPNQIAIGSKNSKGTYLPHFGLKQSWLGRIPGTPDYCFLGKKESFFIEFKGLKQKQSENQKIFEEWCLSKEVDYYVCKSFEEGVKILKKYIDKEK